MVSEISFTALFFIIQWTGILDKFVSLQSLILKDNTMNEYVDFYMQRCLQVATSIDDKSKHIILNNIKAINYEEAVKLAKTIIIDDNKRKLLLSEEVFVNDSTLAQYLEREELDALKLWRLSVLLYAMIMGCNVAELSISVADQYLDLFNHLNDGMKVASIEVVGRLATETKKGKSSTKTKKFTISSELLINKIKQAYLELQDDIVTVDNLKHYTIERITTMNEIANKRILNYYFAQELKGFLSKYKGGKMSSNRKKLVLYILYLFGRFKNNVPINTDNYRALMRDYNKSPIKLSLFTVNGQSFPLILLPNPEIEKIRSKYRRFIEEM